jgi:CBS domain-containing protein
MSPDVELVSPDATIGDAARKMRDGDFGALPIGENDRLVGMITDRDIAVRAVAEQRDPTTPVREVMSEGIRYCFEDDDVDHAAQLMAASQVRRLPVVNREKCLVGVVTMADLARTGGNAVKPAIQGVSEEP